MSMSRKTEERFLDKDEKEFVGLSHHPEIQELSDAALSDLIGKLRDRRDKARDVGARQRREMRGKAAPTRGRAAADNTGTREKQAVLAAALKRANKERERRRETVAA
ncbi:MAG: hypothetical protein EA385_04555 [Salinarimonadaceae bacterium]|nr:MAG: hypothetical protein EA385_04555 [Salinarimonadaceae bacterium]